MDENCHVEPVEKAVTVQEIEEADRAFLAVGGMGCPNCAARVHNGLLALDGVYRADVSLEFAMADVLYDSQKISTDALIEAVRRAGNDGQHEYHAALIVEE